MRKLKVILRNSVNQDLNQINLDSLKRNAYGWNLLVQLLQNYQDRNLIKKISFSVGNISLLANNDYKKSNRTIVKINGQPGSGKTIFAFLLFVTEPNLLLIVSNKSFFKEFKSHTIEVEKHNKNKFILIWDLIYKNQIIESELSNFKTIVIDESQNIDNDILISIAHFCKSHKIKLFLLSDYKQNIYAWLNLEDLEDLEDNDKLLQKQKLLENSLKEIYEIDKKKRISYEWTQSNRINKRDLKKIDYIVFGDTTKLESYLKYNDEKTFLQIYPCIESNLLWLSNKYSRKQIFIVSHFNWMYNLNQIDGDEYSYYNQYQHIGYEYDELAIYLPKNFEYDEKSKKLIYRFVNQEKCKEEVISDDALKAWLYVAFTRATKIIRIFVSQDNKYKDKICEYFNNRIQQLAVGKDNANSDIKNNFLPIVYSKQNCQINLIQLCAVFLSKI